MKKQRSGVIINTHHVGHSNEPGCLPIPSRRAGAITPDPVPGLGTRPLTSASTASALWPRYAHASKIDRPHPDLEEAKKGLLATIPLESLQRPKILPTQRSFLLRNGSSMITGSIWNRRRERSLALRPVSQRGVCCYYQEEQDGIEKKLVDTCRHDLETFPKEEIAVARNMVLTEWARPSPGPPQRVRDPRESGERVGGKEEASLLVYGGKVPAHHAFLTNSTMARAWISTIP